MTGTDSPPPPLPPASNGSISSADFLRRFTRTAKAVIQQGTYFSELDVLGDSDLGMNISKGFDHALKQLAQEGEGAGQGLDIGKILTIAGDAFMDVGSTIGMLFGSALTEAGKAAEGMATLDTAGFATILRAMLSSVKSNGGAKVGDKTLVDALEPAALAAEAAAKENRSLAEALAEAASAAQAGCNATVDMVARMGRASYLRERSRGRADPGAAFIAFFLQSMSQPE